MEKKYIKTTIISAMPMRRHEFDKRHGYVTDGEPDWPDGDGYISINAESGAETWREKELFEENYRRVDGMSFGLAIEAMKKGKRMARAGWNGKGMWLTFVQPGQWQVSTEVPGMEDQDLLTAAWIGMKTADSKFVPWLPSQTDMLADDWQIVE